MNTKALAIVEAIEGSGGSFSIDGEWLVIEPPAVALPLIDDLRAHKQEILAVIQTRVSAAGDCDLEQRRQQFIEWTWERCASRAGRDDAGFVGSLHVNFCEWSLVRYGSACSRVVFENLLTDASFRCADGFVRGLVLREDLESVVGPRDSPTMRVTHKPYANRSAGAQR